MARRTERRSPVSVVDDESSTGSVAVAAVAPARRERPATRRARDTAAAARLWAEAERLTGVHLAERVG